MPSRRRAATLTIPRLAVGRASRRRAPARSAASWDSGDLAGAGAVMTVAVGVGRAARRPPPARSAASWDSGDLGGAGAVMAVGVVGVAAVAWTLGVRLT